MGNDGLRIINYKLMWIVDFVGNEDLRSPPPPAYLDERNGMHAYRILSLAYALHKSDSTIFYRKSIALFTYCQIILDFPHEIDIILLCIHLHN